MFCEPRLKSGSLPEPTSSSAPSRSCPAHCSTSAASALFRSRESSAPLVAFLDLIPMFTALEPRRRACGSPGWGACHDPDRESPSSSVVVGHLRTSFRKGGARMGCGLKKAFKSVKSTRALIHDARLPERFSNVHPDMNVSAYKQSFMHYHSPTQHHDRMYSVKQTGIPNHESVLLSESKKIQRDAVIRFLNE